MVAQQTAPERDRSVVLIGKADLQHFVVHLRERGVKPVTCPNYGGTELGHTDVPTMPTQSLRRGSPGRSGTRIQHAVEIASALSREPSH